MSVFPRIEGTLMMIPGYVVGGCGEALLMMRSDLHVDVRMVEKKFLRRAILKHAFCSLAKIGLWSQSVEDGVLAN